MAPHFYMGPVPAFFDPAFQLMDYGIHSWDILEGTGREHGLHSDVADLLVPFMFGILRGPPPHAGRRTVPDRRARHHRPQRR